MYHHGGIKQRLLPELFQPKEVLHIGVFSDGVDCSLIGQFLMFLDENCPVGNPRGECATPGLRTHALGINILNVLPGHHVSHFDPAVILAQLASEGQEKLLQGQLIAILHMVHPNTP